jgi:hypothetical protein
MKARETVMIRRHNERAWLAYHSGLFSRPLKRYPTLESLQIRKMVPSKPRQTWQEQLAIAHMWASKNHGKIGKAN